MPIVGVVIPSERSESRNRSHPDRGMALFQGGGDSSTPPLRGSARNDSDT
jgi:hypothetical protein